MYNNQPLETSDEQKTNIESYQAFQISGSPNKSINKDEAKPNQKTAKSSGTLTVETKGEKSNTSDHNINDAF